MVNYCYSDTEGLAEVYPGYRVIQEPWRAGFRRWRVTNGAYETRRGDVPLMEWLDADGEPIGGLAPPCQRLMLQIPPRERRLAAPFDTYQWLALEAMRLAPGFTAFLAQETAGAGLSYVAACWELAETPRRGAAERIALATRLMQRPRVEVLADLSGLPDLDEACVRLICKVPPAEMDSALVNHLVGLATASPAARQALQSLKHFNRWDLSSLRELPPWMQHPVIAGIIARDKVGPSRLAPFITAAIRGCGAEDQARIMDSLLQAGTAEMFLHRLERWDRRLSRALPFPPPPIRGNGLLVPITSADELAREGRDMRHCVAGYAEDVRAGIVYYYRWLASERATVQLAPGGECGTWIVEEALGPGNAALLPATLAAIEQVVASQRPAGPLCAPIAGLAHHQVATVAGLLKPGHSLVLRREPGNRQDPRAIEVLTVLGVKLGYVPRAVNAEPAARLDRGEALDAWVLSVSDDGPPGRVTAIDMAITTRRQAGGLREAAARLDSQCSAH